MNTILMGRLNFRRTQALSVPTKEQRFWALYEGKQVLSTFSGLGFTLINRKVR